MTILLTLARFKHFSYLCIIRLVAKCLLFCSMSSHRMDRLSFFARSIFWMYTYPWAWWSIRSVGIFPSIGSYSKEGFPFHPERIGLWINSYLSRSSGVHLLESASGGGGGNSVLWGEAFFSRSRGEVELRHRGRQNSSVTNIPD